MIIETLYIIIDTYILELENIIATYDYISLRFLIYYYI